MGSSPQKRNLLVNALGQEQFFYLVSCGLVLSDLSSQHTSSITDKTNEIKDIEKD